MALPPRWPPDVRFHWDAGQQPEADGVLVPSLIDQSPNAWHGAQGTSSKQGTRRIAGLGGKPSVLFDGVDDFYVLPTAAGALFTSVPAATVLVVAADTGSLTIVTAGAHRRMFHASVSTSNAARVFLQHATAKAAGEPYSIVTGNRRLNGDTGQDIPGSPTTATDISASPIAYLTEHDYNTARASNTRNGSGIASRDPYQAAGLSDSGAHATVIVGASSTSPGLPWKGHLALIACWGRVLTAAERREVARYVQDTYGLVHVNYPKVTIDVALPTTGGPFTDVVIERKRGTGDWTRINPKPSTAASFTDPTAAANDLYRTAVASSAGLSAYSPEITYVLGTQKP